MQQNEKPDGLLPSLSDTSDTQPSDVQPQQSRTYEAYLIVYSDAVNPAHWSSYFVPKGGATGTTIEVKAHFLGGFERLVKPFADGLSGSLHEKFLLGEFDESSFQTAVSTAGTIDANGVGCDLSPQVVSRSLSG